MKPYRRSNKAVMVELRTASIYGKIKIYIREFLRDVHLLWKYGTSFPTFLKLLATLILFLIVIMPLLYPGFILLCTYFTFEGLYLSWKLSDPRQFLPTTIANKAYSVFIQPCNTKELWKVREMLMRGVLVVHSLATSVDYLCVMQSLLDEI